MSALSHRTELLLEHLYAPHAQAHVRALLEANCSTDTLGCNGWSAEQMERLWFAVLKLGSENPGGIVPAVELAKTDVRDLLMAAGFGEDTHAHRRWQASVC